MKKNLLYIGNRLINKGATATTIDTLGQYLQAEGFEIKYASSFKNKILRLLHMIWATLRLSGKTDFILIDTYSTQNFWYAVTVGRLAQLLNLKYIPILHGGNLPQRLKNNPVITQTLFKNAYFNVAPSPYLYEIFKEKRFTNTICIPNSIVLKNYEFLKRKNFKPNILWVRSFAEIYNPMLALKVVQELRLTVPEVRLTMVGPDKDGSLSSCKAFAKANNLPVEFKGKLKKKEWIDISKEYDLFINTSNYDNMPVSIIEAMALGLAIVSTHVGGIPFLLTDTKTAKLVPASSVKKFVSAIQNTLKYQKDTQLQIENARQKALNYDWQKVKLQWLKLLS